MRQYKKCISLLLVLALAMSLCGCRVRTTKISPSPIVAPLQAQTEQTPPEDSEGESDEGGQSDKEKPLPADKKSNPEKRNNRKKSPDRKKGSSTAEERTPDDKGDSVIKDKDDKAEDNGSNGQSPSEDIRGDINDENEDDSQRNDLTEADESNQQEPAPVQVSVEKYDSLLSRTNSQIYECQRAFVYFELEQEYTSALRHTQIHSVIENAGGYNVAEIKATPITDEWIADKNPDLIVKLVPPDILGEGITDAQAAMAEADRFLSNPMLSSVKAVQSRSILLLSSSLLDTEAGTKTAELYLAKAMYPALYTELDVELAFGEMAGHEPNGIYAVMA